MTGFFQFLFMKSTCYGRLLLKVPYSGTATRTICWEANMPADDIAIKMYMLSFVYCVQFLNIILK